jgi:hypothetical protein
MVQLGSKFLTSILIHNTQLNSQASFSSILTGAFFHLNRTHSKSYLWDHQSTSK